MSLTRVSPALFQVSNNITSVTVGGSANTISLTFDSNGVITGASNNALLISNTAITGNIISSQIAPSVTLTTPIISGNLNLDSAGTTGIRVPSANTIALHTAGTQQAGITSAGLLQFNSGYGSVATAYGCRAWVNFNGTGTPAIRASGNVSSIGDQGTGKYTINFTTAMSDTNYSVVGSTSLRAADGWSPPTLALGYDTGNVVVPATTSIDISTAWPFNETFHDMAQVHVAVFR